jgi:hypothetical protein
MDLNEIASKAKDGIINLGTANGWRTQDGETYKVLREQMIPNSGERTELGRCWTQHSFKINHNDVEYIVIHNVDSGD